MKEVIGGYSVSVFTGRLIHHLDYVHPFIEDIILGALRDAPGDEPVSKLEISPTMVSVPEPKESIIHLENGITVRMSPEGQVKFGLGV